MTSRLGVHIILPDISSIHRYALICQDEGLVPIVEPDISLNGNYDLETAIRVNVKVQAHLYKAMLDHGVFMEGSTLKPNMVNPGRGCRTKATAQEIGEATVTTLRRVMPAAMPGVNFLSGGQTLEDAAARLCAINQVCHWLCLMCASGWLSGAFFFFKILDAVSAKLDHHRTHSYFMRQQSV